VQIVNKKTEQIHLIGSEGFIGKAIKKKSSENNIKLICWSHTFRKTDNFFDLYDKKSWGNLLSSNPKKVILLSWPNLPNYNEKFHLTKNLISYIDLVEKLIDNGVEKLVFAGTCYEYGLQNGKLKENHPTEPMNLYAISKDCLRRTIKNMCERVNVKWCWLRIFYPYGDGQNPNSLIPSLEKSIKEKKEFFEMSSGTQIRDFIKVENVAQQLMSLAISTKSNGVYNGCSGNPKTLYEIVEKKIKDANSKIKIKTGVYPDREDEPKAFWGDKDKINNL